MLRISYTTSFLLPLLCLGDTGTTQECAHSLYIDFTVTSQHRPGQPWCEVQGSVDQRPFFQYNSDSNKVKPLGHLGEKVNATKTWTALTQTLGEAGNELRMILSVIKLEETRDSGPPTLQARMSCRRQAERCTGASWQFSFNGQTAFLFDTMNKKWILIHPEAREIKEDWENNKGLTEYLRRLSMGDCNYLLRKFLEHWEKSPEFSGHWENSVSSPRSPDAFKSSAIQLIAWVIPTIVICSVLIVIMS